MNDVLVYEPKSVGHFLGFAMKAAEAFANLGAGVTLAVPRHAKGGQQAEVKLADPPPNVTVEFCLEVPRGYDQWRNGRYEAETLGELLLDRRPGHLVIPSGDFLLCGLLVRPGVRRRLAGLPGDVVLHNCVAAYPRIGFRNRLGRVWDQVAATAAPSGLALHTVDPFVLSSEARGRILFGRRPVAWLPHFLDYNPRPVDLTEAREALGLPLGKRLLGSIGDLGTRKGTELLIRSFSGSGPAADSVLVLFGKLSPSAKSVLAEYPRLIEEGRVIIRDQFVSDDDFRLFFSAIDVFWAGFPNQIGFSSTLLHAAVAGRLVVGSDYGFVGWFIRRHGLGRACPAIVDAMSEAIEWAIDAVDTSSWKAQGEQVLQGYGGEFFAEALTSGFRAGACVSGSLENGVVAGGKAEGGKKDPAGVQS